MSNIATLAAPATVEAEPDPREPGRTAFRVTSLYSPGAVQRAVAEIMNGEDVEVAQFTHVQRMTGGGIHFPHWGALGYVVARRQVFAVAAE